MFRYILVPAGGSDADMPAFRTALALARAASGHLAFLHARLDVQKLVISMAAGDVGGTAGIADVLQRLEQDAGDAEARSKQRVVDFCAQEHVALADSPLDERPSAEWHSETGDAARLLAAHGRTADLTVVGRLRDDGSVNLSVLQTVLLDSGRPLLVVPPHPPAAIGRRVAIAWKDSTEAARAVAATLPLFSAADRVTIVSVEEDARTTADACDRLRRALVWHNAATAVRHVRPEGRDPAEALLAAVTAEGADLLLMGGYSHSRLTEVVFGGVTRHVLQTAELPVLMVH
ncbi:MAG TPA: universal stress protein [Acetobacteraceae bacterium]